MVKGVGVVTSFLRSPRRRLDPACVLPSQHRAYPSKISTLFLTTLVSASKFANALLLDGFGGERIIVKSRKGRVGTRKARTTKEGRARGGSRAERSFMGGVSTREKCPTGLQRLEKGS